MVWCEVMKLLLLTLLVKFNVFLTSQTLGNKFASVQCTVVPTVDLCRSRATVLWPDPVTRVTRRGSLASGARADYRPDSTVASGIE